MPQCLSRGDQQLYSTMRRNLHPDLRASHRPSHSAFLVHGHSENYNQCRLCSCCRQIPRRHRISCCVRHPEFDITDLRSLTCLTSRVTNELQMRVRFAGSDSGSESQSEHTTTMSRPKTTPDSIRNTPQMMRRYYRARNAQLRHVPCPHHSDTAGLFEEMERISAFLRVHEPRLCGPPPPRNTSAVATASISRTRNALLAFSRRAVPAGQR